MKKFPVYIKRDGQGWHEEGYVFAENYEHAKRVWAKDLWDQHMNGKYGDDTLYYCEEDLKDEEGDTSWYEGSGFYNKNLDPFELVLSDEQLDEGVDYFRYDVYSYTLDPDRI